MIIAIKQIEMYYSDFRFLFGLNIVCILIICMSATYSIGEDEWKIVKSDSESDIRIYYKTHRSGNIEFRAKTNVKCSLNSLVALFSDSEKMSEWVYRLESVERIKEVGDTEVYVYTIHSMPWPFKYRDSVVHSILKQDPQSKKITIHGKASPNYIPKKKGFERITVVESTWTFNPQEDNTVQVVFQGYGEPGGDIISSIYRSPIFRWLVELYLWELPYNTLVNLKDYIKKPKYQSIKYSYIEELNE